MNNNQIYQELKEIKEEYPLQEGERILDIKYYLNVLINKEKISICVVRTEKEGKTKTEIYAEDRLLAQTNEQGEFITTEFFKEKYRDESKLLNGLINTNSFSLETLEQMREKSRKKEGIKIPSDKKAKKQQKEEAEQEPLKTSVEDIQIAAEFKLDELVDEHRTLRDFMKDNMGKQYTRVVVERIDNKGYQFYGITSGGEIEPIPMQPTEGTNPTEKIATIKSENNKEPVVEMQTPDAMFVFENRKQEGISLKTGEMGIQEAYYFRRTPEDDYHQKSLAMESTSLKTTRREAQEDIDRNNTTKDHIQEDYDAVEENGLEEVTLEKMHEEERKIEEAANSCHMTVEGFKVEYDQTTGDTVEERIEEAKERVEEQARPNKQR